MTVTLAAKEGPLSYRIEHGAEGSRSEIIRESPLGLRLEQQDFAAALQFVQALPRRTVEESYAMPHGKRLARHYKANELVLLFQNPAGLPLAVVIRVFDNGVAFRYSLPTGLEGAQTLEAEATGFALPLDAKLWCAASDKATTYSPAYEVYYENEIAVGTPSPTGLGWSFPLLLRTGDGPPLGIDHGGQSRGLILRIEALQHPGGRDLSDRAAPTGRGQRTRLREALVHAAVGHALAGHRGGGLACRHRRIHFGR